MLNNNIIVSFFEKQKIKYLNFAHQIMINYKKINSNKLKILIQKVE